MVVYDRWGLCVPCFAGLPMSFDRLFDRLFVLSALCCFSLSLLLFPRFLAWLGWALHTDLASCACGGGGGRECTGWVCVAGHGTVADRGLRGVRTDKPTNRSGTRG
ncbi:hypothetical protein PICMEDRAFT_97536 [Pichia membranifaciens NRRL Y-2026]|uniref:Uncharacterized protein n=1 Tax=Pichia membranifaciens NRRL Y-2026 TaxID=763406 RepID=A0A1E3NSY4_9ASCO|nr:hypothetical protein PICMEDRAFT_97536 [Pichia membranifaciens NRRL Y-2026]ODQ49219.1 hypothetical protein PICMEDRAFT_97536 [Pichia membranifaciens NRRL Y-2026]